MEHAAHRRGSICTSIRYTPDLERTAAFCNALLGWDTAGSGPHRLLTHQGQIVASLQQSSRLNELVPHISVDDLEQTIAAAVALGATMVERHQAGGVANLAVLRDREGARFGLWQPSPVEGIELSEVAGSLWWPEVLSDDPPIAKQFYASLFGWQTRETAFEPFAAYTVFERDGNQEGGVLPIGPDWGVTPHWNSIFAVDDCDAMVRRACELGGQEGFIHTVPKHGRIGSAIDPSGAWIWLRGPVGSR